VFGVTRSSLRTSIQSIARHDFQFPGILTARKQTRHDRFEGGYSVVNPTSAELKKTLASSSKEIYRQEIEKEVSKSLNLQSQDS
jgi:hypothetical protein